MHCNALFVFIGNRSFDCKTDGLDCRLQGTYYEIKKYHGKKNSKHRLQSKLIFSKFAWVADPTKNCYSQYYVRYIHDTVGPSKYQRIHEHMYTTTFCHRKNAII